MRILKVNTYAPDTPLYQAFGPDVEFDIHRDPAEPGFAALRRTLLDALGVPAPGPATHDHADRSTP